MQKPIEYSCDICGQNANPDDLYNINAFLLNNKKPSTIAIQFHKDKHGNPHTDLGHVCFECKAAIANAINNRSQPKKVTI